MQNTIIKEFANHPDVVVVPMDQGGRLGETLDWLQTLWDNVYLRNGVLFDEPGSVGALYGQPQLGLPFGRGFIIDRDGKVDLPYFGHRPQMVIDRIYELLETTGVGDGPGAGGRSSLLVTGVPNPFQGSTRIQYRLPMVERIDLEIFDLSGRRVRRLVSSVDQTPGRHEYTWDGLMDSGAAAPAGVYYCRLTTGRSRESGKLILLR
jgi:hypothetical protein